MAIFVLSQKMALEVILGGKNGFFTVFLHENVSSEILDATKAPVYQISK